MKIGSESNVLRSINGREKCDIFASNGFFTHAGMEHSTVEGTLAMLEKPFGPDA